MANSAKSRRDPKAGCHQMLRQLVVWMVVMTRHFPRRQDLVTLLSVLVARRMMRIHQCLLAVALLMMTSLMSPKTKRIFQKVVVNSVEDEAPKTISTSELTLID